MRDGPINHRPLLCEFYCDDKIGRALSNINKDIAEGKLIREKILAIVPLEVAGIGYLRVYHWS